MDFFSNFSITTKLIYPNQDYNELEEATDKNANGTGFSIF
jgi:hypothetical protein